MARRPPLVAVVNWGDCTDLKLPAYVQFREEVPILIWKPRGILDEGAVMEMVTFIEGVERRNKTPLNRFTDLSGLDAVDLNFKFVFYVALGRRLSAQPKPPVKSAFYVTSRATAHFTKLHALLTDYSPLEVCLFTEMAEAAKWLEVPLDILDEDVP